MYFAMVWGLMLVIPVLSVIIESILTTAPDFVWLIAKWFVFWGIGIRLLIAGVKQVVQPSFTARTIFKMSSPDAEKLVSEIGFGNVALGLVSTLSIVFPAFVTPMALTGGLFLGLAGVKHARNANRSPEETTALITDLIIGVIGISSAVLLLLR
ncbi:DUF6790 family protein [Pseudomonas sp. NPDC086278]|uniref:DUF6790 family protein n=1 Tax=Pseudomonas sp. NPDC086278 TaxID=3390646 RepID=UPI003CFFE259